jgi:hexaprenyl-diphosphate synthase
MLDFTATESAFGKPSNGADLKLGLATAPALYAWEQHPNLGPLIARNFSHDGDVEQVRPSARTSCSRDCCYLQSNCYAS